ncbi:hypothetical protein Anas_12454, partial [Armadillidium nasatum]
MEREKEKEKGKQKKRMKKKRGKRREKEESKEEEEKEKRKEKKEKSRKRTIKRWDFLRKAIRKLLVYDLPAGHEVGVVLFDEDSSVKLPLTPTPSALEKRQRLATASGTPVPLSKYDSGKLEQEVRRGKIQLVPIMYPVTTRNPQPTPGVEHLAEIS